RQVLRASILEGLNDKRLDAAMDAFQEDLTALEYSLLHKEELTKLLDDGEVRVRDSLDVLMDEVLADEQWREGEKTLNIRKVALVPMVVENEPLGVVVFAFDRKDPDVEVLELLVGHLTLALRDLLVRDEAVRFSDIDGVTWVPNRRYLTRELENEIVRAGRYGRGLAVVALDIDGFGAFNETYGQSMGDRLLRTVATTLAEAVTPPELVARLKDDDFVVLLPETNRATAVTVTTRLLASLSNISVFSNGEEEAPPITLSVAIACFPEDADTPSRLLSRVLGDLERAKQDRPDDRRYVRAAV
ncbi:MAG: GGDEF domain-containing protein, partial [Dehalococcoidia bacterium]